MLFCAVQKVKAQDDPDLVVLETDNVLFKDPGFRCVFFIYLIICAVVCCDALSLGWAMLCCAIFYMIEILECDP